MKFVKKDVIEMFLVWGGVSMMYFISAPWKSSFIGLKDILYKALLNEEN